MEQGHHYGRCLAVCLVLYVEERATVDSAAAQRAWAEYAVANLVLHLAVLNFMG